jgi:predicted component of type VI protein secretion system
MVRPGRENTWLAFGPGEYRFGRSPECQVRIGLDNKQSVGRQHCLLRVTEHAAIIRDLHIRNGTIVNCEWIKEERELRDGDCILVGKISFHVHLTEGDELSKAVLCSGFREDNEETISVPDDRTKSAKLMIEEPNKRSSAEGIAR